MSNSRTRDESVPRPGGGGPPRRASQATRIFATPGTVTQLPIVEVQKAAARPASAPAQPPPAPRPITPTPTRAVNEPTRIVAVRPSPDAGREAKPSVVVQEPGTPLLRAFDDARHRTNTWATARTIAAPLTELNERREAPVTAPMVRARPVAPRLRAPSPLRQVARRMTPRAARQIVIVIAASAAVIGLGTLLGGGIAQGLVPGHPTREVPAATPAAPVAPNPNTEARPTPPQPELGAATAPLPEPLASPVTTARPAASSVPPRAARRAAPPLEARGAHEPTLARQAIDALLGGDRGKALEHYRELSRRAPENLAYREAVRLLTATSPETNRAP